MINVAHKNRRIAEIKDHKVLSREGSEGIRSAIDSVEKGMRGFCSVPILYWIGVNFFTSLHSRVDVPAVKVVG